MWANQFSPTFQVWTPTAEHHGAHSRCSGTPRARGAVCPRSVQALLLRCLPLSVREELGSSREPHRADSVPVRAGPAMLQGHWLQNRDRCVLENERKRGSRNVNDSPLLGGLHLPTHPGEREGKAHTAWTLLPLGPGGHCLRPGRTQPRSNVALSSSAGCGQLHPELHLDYLVQ